MGTLLNLREIVKVDTRNPQKRIEEEKIKWSKLLEQQTKQSAEKIKGINEKLKKQQKETELAIAKMEKNQQEHAKEKNALTQLIKKVEAAAEKKLEQIRKDSANAKEENEKMKKILEGQLDDLKKKLEEERQRNETRQRGETDWFSSLLQVAAP